MGWTSLHRPAGISNRDFFQPLFPGCEIVADGARRAGRRGGDYQLVYYAAMRDRADGQAWALVVLMGWSPSAWHNFAYKEMDETAGPAEADPPAPVLAALTPTDNQAALAWRSRAAHAAAVRRAQPAARPGDRVRFAHPYRLPDGRQADTLTFLRRSTFRTPAGTLVRIPNWRQSPHTVHRPERPPQAARTRASRNVRSQHYIDQYR